MEVKGKPRRDYLHSGRKDVNKCDRKVEGIGDRNMRGDRVNGWEDGVGW